MLYIYYGSDQVAVRQKAHSTLDDLLGPDEQFVRIEGEQYEPGLMASLGSGASLFSPRLVYLLESPLSHSLWAEELLENIAQLAESTHAFVIINEAIAAPEKKKIGASAVEMEEYKAITQSSFNPFKMADALAVKDKKTLWLLLQEAREHNLSAEEIIGTLWWQLKAIRLAAITKSPEEAGMKDYPYKKAKAALRTFTISDVIQKSRSLLALYHAGHKGQRDINLALEQWVLTL